MAGALCPFPNLILTKPLFLGGAEAKLEDSLPCRWGLQPLLFSAGRRKWNAWSACKSRPSWSCLCVGGCGGAGRVKETTLAGRESS